MLIKRLPNWNMTNEQPAFYDLDSKSAVEMTAKLYKFVQEMTDTLNDYCADMETTVNNYKNFTEKDMVAFKTAIEQKFQDFTEILNTKYEYIELMISEIDKLIKDLNEGRGE